MYYQVFYRRQIDSPVCQVSCDTHLEVQQEIERLGRPKFVNVHYLDSEGVIGVGKKMYLELKEVYVTYKKIRF